MIYFPLLLLKYNQELVLVFSWGLLTAQIRRNNPLPFHLKTTTYQYNELNALKHVAFTLCMDLLSSVISKYCIHMKFTSLDASVQLIIIANIIWKQLAAFRPADMVKTW